MMLRRVPFKGAIYDCLTVNLVGAGCARLFSSKNETTHFGERTVLSSEKEDLVKGSADFDLVSETVVFVSMRSVRNWYQI